MRERFKQKISLIADFSGRPSDDGQVGAVCISLEYCTVHYKLLLYDYW